MTRTAAFLFPLFFLVTSACQPRSAVFRGHLSIVNIAPSHGTIGVPYDATVVVTFSDAVQPASVVATSFCLRNDAPASALDPCSGALAAATSWDAASLSARLVPSTPLLPDRTYTVYVTPGVASANGSLPAVVSASFQTIPSGT